MQGVGFAGGRGPGCFSRGWFSFLLLVIFACLACVGHGEKPPRFDQLGARLTTTTNTTNTVRRRVVVCSPDVIQLKVDKNLVAALRRVAEGGGQRLQYDAKVSFFLTNLLHVPVSVLPRSVFAVLMHVRILPQAQGTLALMPHAHAGTDEHAGTGQSRVVPPKSPFKCLLGSFSPS